MMNDMDSFKEKLAFSLFGRGRDLAIAGKGCVCCGGRADTFRDAISEREYGISGLCNPCQDRVFGTDED